jgi:hypothetical protein
MNGNYLCTGDIKIPNPLNYSQIKEFINRISDSLEIPNLDSALRTNFGNINLDQTFIDNCCVPESNISKGEHNFWDNIYATDNGTIDTTPNEPSEVLLSSPTENCSIIYRTPCSETYYFELSNHQTVLNYSHVLSSNVDTIDLNQSEDDTSSEEPP